MNRKTEQHGFSLAETIIALGILAVGLLFIAGVFPVGIHFTNISMDRTIASATADEAFAKTQLLLQKLSYDVNDEFIGSTLFAYNHMVNVNDLLLQPQFEEYQISYNFFTYPSILSIPADKKHYCWSALCRNFNDHTIEITVFVCKKPAHIPNYYFPNDDWGSNDYGRIENYNLSSYWPKPVRIEVDDSGLEEDELRIENPDELKLITEGCRIVDDEHGTVYRVMEKYPPPDDDIILLDREKEYDIDYIWTVPPSQSGGKSPLIAVYQKILRY